MQSVAARVIWTYSTVSSVNTVGLLSTKDISSGYTGRLERYFACTAFQLIDRNNRYIYD